jgi:hypothetical protein
MLAIERTLPGLRGSRAGCKGLLLARWPELVTEVPHSASQSTVGTRAATLGRTPIRSGGAHLHSVETGAASKPEGAAGRQGICSKRAAHCVRARAKVLPFPPARAFPPSDGDCRIHPAALWCRGEGVQLESRVAKRARGAPMKPRHRWRSFAVRNRRRTSQVVSACAAFERKRKAWLAAGFTFGGSSSRRLKLAGSRFADAARRGRRNRSARPVDRRRGSVVTAPLAPRQRRTLDVGSWVVLSGLGFGYQLGGWPAWTVFAGIGSYALWVVLYAEITIQASRRRLSSELGSASAPDPEPEQRPAQASRKQGAKQQQNDLEAAVPTP